MVEKLIEVENKKMKLNEFQSSVLRLWVGHKSFARKEAAERKEIDLNKGISELVELKVFKLNKNGVARNTLSYDESINLIKFSNGVDAQEEIKSARESLASAIKRLDENTCCFSARDLGESVRWNRERLETAIELSKMKG